MSEPDWRICSLCNSEVDLNHEDVRVLSTYHGYKTTVMVNGAVHVLLSKEQTRKARGDES